MPWYAVAALVILIILTAGIKGILVFSFCAIISFIFARNLFDGESELDFTSYFTSKGFGWTRERKTSAIEPRPFPRRLKGCRHALTRNILRDFVISWYENVGVGGDFILETRALLEEASVHLYDNVARTSVSSHAEKLCILLHRHITAFQATELSNCEENFVKSFSTLQNGTRTFQSNELQYLRTVVDLLLYRLVAPQTLKCETGRFILREILAGKLLLPLANKLSDPDFINTSIINVFGVSLDEVPLTSSLKFNETSESNLKALTPLLEYLDESLDVNNSNDCNSKPSQFTKYKFNNAAVIEKDHKEIVELSLEANFQESNDASNFVNQTEFNSSQIQFKKTAESFVGKKPNERSHAFTVNGLSNFKYDKEQSKFKAFLSAGIHPRNFRRIQSAPVINHSTTGNLYQTPVQDILSEKSSVSEFHSDLSKEIGKDSSLSHGSGLESKLDMEEALGPSLPKVISHSMNNDSTSSNLEENEIYEHESLANMPDSHEMTKESIDTGKNKLKNLSDSEKVKLGETSFGPATSQLHAASSTSTEEWDGNFFEQDLAFDEHEDTLLESDGEEISLKPRKVEADNVSSASFAIQEEPNPCSMISICSTQLVTDHSFEPYKSRYTVYVIVYDTQLWLHSENENNPENEQSEADRQGVMKRRYREFMQLHHRLTVGSVARSMKDIPKPNRKFNSPFFRLDQDVIEGRRHLLENYLKCLVSKPDILHCEDFKGFLGIGDESHTDFRRYLPNMPLPNVPRIDKKLQMKVTQIIDHIKTAFDTTPVEGDKEEEYEDIRQVLGEDKTSPDEIRTFAICSHGCKLNHSCCYSDNCFRTFLLRHREENKAVVGPSEQVASNANPLKKTGIGNGHASKDLKRDPTHLSDLWQSSEGLQKQSQENNPLTKTALNLGCKLLEKHKSWVCLEPVQQAATSVFGCFLEWWMESLLSELVTEEQWQYYLKLLADTLWPGGELMKSAEEEKSEAEKLKTKEKAVQTLTNFFGAVLHTAIGKETIESSAREIIESFQYSEMNRQLLFEALEVILAEVFPDLADETELYFSSRNC